jgi:hypothetical protein
MFKILRPKSLLVILLVIGIVTAILFIPVELPYAISTAGKILPAKSWVIVKGNNGQLISLLHNRKKGIVDSYSVKEFERGDNVSFTLSNWFGIGRMINEKDTIGYIYSNEIERQLAVLQSEIEVAKSLLEFNISGEKGPVIKEAEENLNYQIKNASEQEKIFRRQEALFQKDLISQEEFDLAVNQADLNKISIAIARARFESVSTGAKQEQIELIKSQIRALQNQADILKKRLSSYSIVSPISGMVNSLSSGDTLFTISENSDFVVMVPVKINDMEFIKINSEILITLPSSSKKLRAFIEFIDNSAMDFSGSQVVLAVASVEPNDRLLNGLMVECEIDGGTANLRDHIKRFMNKSVF